MRGASCASTRAKTLRSVPCDSASTRRWASNCRASQYVLEQGVEQFKEFRQLISGGGTSSIGIFRLPRQKEWFTAPECQIHALARPSENRVGAL